MLLSTTSCCSGPRGREKERGRKDRHLEKEVGFYRRDADGDGVGFALRATEEPASCGAPPPPGTWLRPSDARRQERFPVMVEAMSALRECLILYVLLGFYEQ
ncbi:hypothetical protein EYF80_010177 [Liparis tanakae]|uniref:Uncharacterized protein n=1 Tax=Liparis tanakae TaxID=230148 RepID=A0A4Z2INX3_9TELE|nr:hypothetical protein EYF80_010177 [Liparis tanakae]